jgi:hypothetical protein
VIGVVHRFVNYQKGGIIATNIVTSKSISTHEFDTFTIADLENMDSDCTAITLRLAFSRRNNETRNQDVGKRAVAI